MVRKFLIISTYAPPAISGAPLMMYNVLRHFPEDSFAVLTSHVSLDDRAIEDGRRLRAKYFFFDTPRQATAPQGKDTLFRRGKRFIKRFNWLRLLFHFVSLFYLPFNIVRRGKNIVKEEKIELLLGYSDHGPALISTYLLHKWTKKPLCVHFYDLYYGNKFPWFFQLAARFMEPRLFRSAERISVMSEALAEHYQNKYGREVAVLHNAIGMESARTPEPIPVHAEPYKVVYTGTIVWAQAGAIRNLVHAVQELSSPKVVLYLYTPHDTHFLATQGIFESDRVIFARGLPQEMAGIQKSADILFVGLSFNTRYPLLINTSSPGKACEYLISGRPILIHAPKESYIAKYGRQHGFAHVADEDSIKELKNGILRLISDGDYAGKLISNASKTGLSNHDDKAVSTRMQRVLIGLVAGFGSHIEIADTPLCIN